MKQNLINCPDCKGSGTITTSHEFVHCNRCNGSGKIVNHPYVIIIEGTVYKVNRKQFDEIKKISEKHKDTHNDDLNVSEFLEENKHKYKLIGDIDYDFRL